MSVRFGSLFLSSSPCLLCCVMKNEPSFSFSVYEMIKDFLLFFRIWREWWWWWYFVCIFVLLFLLSLLSRMQGWYGLRTTIHKRFRWKSTKYGLPKLIYWSGIECEWSRDWTVWKERMKEKKNSLYYLTIFTIST